MFSTHVLDPPSHTFSTILYHFYCCRTHSLLADLVYVFFSSSWKCTFNLIRLLEMGFGDVTAESSFLLFVFRYMKSTQNVSIIEIKTICFGQVEKCWTFCWWILLISKFKYKPFFASIFFFAILCALHFQPKVLLCDASRKKIGYLFFREKRDMRK